MELNLNDKIKNVLSKPAKQSDEKQNKITDANKNLEEALKF